MRQTTHSWEESRFATAGGSRLFFSRQVFGVAVILLSMLLPVGLGSGRAWAASLSVIEEAAQSGDRGMRVLLDEPHPGYVQDDSPSALKQYRARFYVRADSLRMRSTDKLAILVGYGGSSESVLFLTLRQSSGTTYLGAAVRLNSHTITELASADETPLKNGWHLIEMYWGAAKDLSSTNGFLNLWVDRKSVTGLTGIGNSLRQVDTVRLGAVQGATGTMSGFFDVDEFVSRTKAYIGATPTTTGIPDVSVQENAANTTIQLFPLFADAETADSALVFSIENNTNGTLFDGVSIDAATGVLTLDYATGEFGESDITIRATDADDLYVESTVTVTVAGNPYDVNNDNLKNALDVQIVINAALGLTVEGDPDVNEDGVVNALDVQLVINAVLGII